MMADKIIFFVINVIFLFALVIQANFAQKIILQFSSDKTLINGSELIIEGSADDFSNGLNTIEIYLTDRDNNTITFCALKARKGSHAKNICRIVEVNSTLCRFIINLHNENLVNKTVVKTCLYDNDGIRNCSEALLLSELSAQVPVNKPADKLWIVLVSTLVPLFIIITVIVIIILFGKELKRYQWCVNRIQCHYYEKSQQEES